MALSFLRSKLLPENSIFRQEGKLGSAARMGLLAIAMFGFGFLLVPIYNVMCKAVGINGKTDPNPYKVVESRVDTSRKIKIQFLATNNAAMSWDFGATVKEIEVHPGEIGSLSFYARNPTGKRMTAQAIPSVTPFKGTDYLHKTECFCFTTQTLDAGEDIDMPLKIIIDQDLPKYIKKLTLSYTLFDVTDM